MKISTSFTLMALFLALTGCQISTTQPSNNRNTTLAEISMHKGIYISGHEVSSYQPCEEALTYWVTATPASDTLNQLSIRLSESRNAPYQPIYIESEIHPVDRNSHPAFIDGFAADYDAVIEITNVTVQLTDIPSHCQQAKRTH